MTSYYKALRAVLWKNWLLTRKQWPWVVAEIVVPILFFALVCYGKANDYPHLDKTSVNVSYGQTTDMEAVKSFLQGDGNWELWYASTNKQHDRLIDYAAIELGLDPRLDVLNFESRKKLLQELHKNTGKKDIYAIIFDDNIDNDQLSYNISVRKRYLEWHTGELYRQNGGLIDDYNPYLHEGFLALQILINKAFIEMKFVDTYAPDISITLQEVITTSSKEDDDKKMQYFFHTILPLSIIFSLCIPIFLNMQKQLISDQRSGLNDLMIISGVPISIIWLGCFIQRTIIILLSLLPLVLFLKESSQVPNCHFIILLLFMLVYCMTATMTYILIACASRNSSIRYVIGLILWMMSSLLATIIIDQDFRASALVKIFLSLLLPNIAVNLGCNILATYESAETKLDFTTLFTSGLSQEDNLPMGYLLSVLVLSMILIFVCSLSIFNMQTLRQSLGLSRKGMQEKEEVPLKQEHPKTNGKSKTLFVAIKNLKKKYDVYTALEIPDLELHQGEITAILGTNGSGKSTLISIVAGVQKNYSGSVVVNHNAGEKERQIGFCPQKNVLFEDFTVKENLLFFAKLRCNDVDDNILKILKDLKLTDCKNVIVRFLSTGIRRKLCLAVALVGHPEIIILDEPTGGVLPEIRQSIGSLLKKRSKNTILITTSSGQEAEFLADKILFINNGKISKEKKTYSELREKGYCISIVISDIWQINEIQKHLKDHLPEITIMQRVGKRLSLCSNGDRNECFKYIKKLEEHKEDWHIETISYNVYLLGNSFTQYLNSSENRLQNDTATFLSNTEGKISTLSNSQFKQRDYGFKRSIFMKKWFILREKFHWYLAGLSIMLLFTCITTLCSSQGRYYYSYSESPIDLSLDLHAKNEVFFSGITETQLESIMKQYMDKVKASTVSEVVVEIDKRVKKGTTKLEDTDIVGIQFLDNNDIKLKVNIVYSQRAFHSAPIAVNLAMNAMLKITKPDHPYTINTKNVPAEEFHSDYVLKELSNAKIFVLWSILMPIGMLFLLADYLTFPNIEFNTQFLRLQATNVEKLVTYWNLQMLIDICVGIFQIVMVLMCMSLLETVLSDDVILGNNELKNLFFILLAYVITQMPASYVFGSFRKVAKGYSKFILFGIVSGTLPLIIYISLLPGGWISRALAYALSFFFPQFAIGYNLYKFGRKFSENFKWDKMNPLLKKFVCHNYLTNPCCLADSEECTKYRSYFNNEEFGIKNSLIASVIAFIVWQCLLIFVSSPRFKAMTIKYNTSQKETITNLLLSETADPDGLVIKDGHFPALNKVIKCAFQPNKLYGVLGANGCGKSVLLATLTKENLLFEGTIYIKKSIWRKIFIKDDNYISQIGYFPRRYDLLYWLTGRELLTLAGLSRGFNIDKSSAAASTLLDIFDLQLLANTKCVDYSGGKQKILQICNAFMGFPDFVVIDHVARSLDIPTIQTVWDFLLAYKKHTKKTVILGIPRTERYNTLCDDCLLMDVDASEHQANDKENQEEHTQKLNTFKIRFRMKIVQEGNDSNKELNACIKNINSQFRQNIVEEGIGSRFYSIKHKSSSLSDLFNKAEDLKEKHPSCIEDYSISQT